ncbi:MAG TPA: hypothetical protein VN823_02550 [Stellaceae bacterium]|nr:hypothetical protein [Stellaceae bacterium]
MPGSAGAAHEAPDSELDAIPSLSPDLVARSTSDPGSTDAPAHLLCSKGKAAATRSRSYDHKDAFEPAQGATAPPSDADVLGSWLKYEGSLPVPADQAKAVSDEDLPTSWYKYETKPVASLLGSTEKARPKASIYLSDTAHSPAAARPNPLTPAMTNLAAAAPEQPSATETPAVPSSPDAWDEQAELRPAELVVTTADASPAPIEPQASEDSPLSASEPEIEIPVDVDAAATNGPEAALPKSPSTPEMPLSAPAFQGPDERLTARHEPLPVELPDEPSALADELPARPTEPEQAVAVDATPIEHTIGSEPQAVSPIALHAAAAPETAGVREDTWDDPEHGDLVESSDQSQAVSMPTAVELVDMRISAAPPPPIEAEAAPVTTAEEQPVSPAIEQPAAQPFELDELPSTEQADSQEFFTPVTERLEQAFEFDNRFEAATSEPTSNAMEPGIAPEELDEPAPISAPAIKTPAPAKKAMLARLADMLERMLPAKRSASAPETPEPAAEPETDEPSSGSIEASSRAMQLEAPAEPEPTASLFDLETAAETAEPATSDVGTDTFVAPEAAVDPIVTESFSAASPVAPEPTHSTVSVEIETAAPESTPVETGSSKMAPPAPILDLDVPPRASAPMVEDADLAGPMLAGTAVVFTDAAEPAPEQETAFVLPQSQPPSTESVPEPQIDPAPIEASQQPSVEESGAFSTEPAAVAAPDNELSETTEPPREALDFAAFGTDAEAGEPAHAEPEIGPEAESARLEAAAETFARRSEVPLEDAAPSRLTEEQSRPVEETSIEAPIDPIPTDAVSELPIDASEAPQEPSTGDVNAFSALPTTDASPEITAASTLQAATEAAIVAPGSLPSETIASVPEASIATVDARAWAEDFPPATPVAEPEEEPAASAAAPEVEPEIAPRESDIFPADAVHLSPPEEQPRALEEAPTEAPGVAGIDVSVQKPRSVEPAAEHTASVIAQASAAPSETVVSPQEEPAEELEPSPFVAHESAAVVAEPPPIASSAVTDATVSTGTGVAASPTEPSIEPPLETVAATETTPATAVPVEGPAPAPVPLPASARVDHEKVAREALTSDLAEMIHSVLSTTEFASRAMKPGRYSSVQSTDEAEPADAAEGAELAAEALPHPAAIRARLGRMERALAFASVGMMIVVGYFAFSLWHDEGVVPVQAPVIAAAPSSSDWGERARDFTREFGAAAAVTPKTPSAPPKAGTIKSADAQQQKSRGAQIAQ